MASGACLAGYSVVCQSQCPCTILGEKKQKEKFLDNEVIFHLHAKLFILRLQKYIMKGTEDRISKGKN